jgi:hypothetical protein
MVKRRIGYKNFTEDELETEVPVRNMGNFED